MVLLGIGFLIQKGIGKDRFITYRYYVEINSTLYHVKSGNIYIPLCLFLPSKGSSSLGTSGFTSMLGLTP